MKRYHRLLYRQLKKLKLDEKSLKSLQPFLEQINEAYIDFDNDLNRVEATLEKSSQELFLANKKIISKYDAVSNKLKKIAKNIKDVIFELDLQGNWQYLNPAWEKLTGYTVEESIGDPCYHPKYFIDSKASESIDLNKTSLNIESTITKIKTVNQEIKYIEISIKRIINKDGIHEGYIGTIIDITKIKNTEYKLLKAKEKETFANKAKDDFLSTMSHEIRTPLNAVIGISHLLLIENPKQEQLENLQTLKYSSEHLLGLVNDILDFNKLNFGALHIEQSEFSISHLLNGIQGIFNNKAKEKNIRFAIKKDNLLPENFIGDSIRLSQILTNLVSNAIKFTEQGKVTLDIEVLSETKDSCFLEILVKDTGIGIPKDKQEKIFNSFAQANSDTTRKYGGTGLGLAICKKLLEIMQSDLKLESAEGKGAVFSFKIELQKSTVAIIKKPKILLEEKSKELILKGIKILVAEDNKVNIMVISKFLRNWKIDFDIAKNGKIAFEMASNNTYDLILMDLQMPVMNGYDSSKLIRDSNNSLNKNTPIYALSASTGLDIKKETLKYRINHLIAKPFDPQMLYKKIKDEIIIQKSNPTNFPDVA